MRRAVSILFIVVSAAATALLGGMSGLTTIGARTKVITGAITIFRQSTEPLPQTALREFRSQNRRQVLPKNESRLVTHDDVIAL
jgi:hypothetical protein